MRNPVLVFDLYRLPQVEYDATGFLEKNRDTLPPGVMDMLRKSDNPLIATVFSGKRKEAKCLQLCS